MLRSRARFALVLGLGIIALLVSSSVPVTASSTRAGEPGFVLTASKAAGRAGQPASAEAGYVATAEPEGSTTQPSSAAMKPAPAPSSAKIKKALQKSLAGQTGRLSISIKDLGTGFSYTYNPGLRTAAASIVKVDILVTLLLQAQKAHRRLTASERRLASRMIEHSDNDAATALWNIVGGSYGLGRANRTLGLRNTVPGPGGYWGSTTTGAKDQVRILGALTGSSSPLNKQNRRYVLGLMSKVTADQAWGVSAAGGTVALKNGWLPRPVDGGRWTVNSIGRVTTGRHTYLIAVISDRHPSLSTGIDAVEDAVRRLKALVAAKPASH